MPGITEELHGTIKSTAQIIGRTIPSFERMILMNEMNYVYEVYRQKSFSRAAKKLFISQPALSSTVKRVEKNLGAQIFDRSTIPLTVTAAGAYYIKSIESIMQINRNINSYFNDIRGLETGTLAIGGSSYFCSFVLPAMIARFHRKHPGIQIDLFEGNVQELNRYLRDEQVDLVIETSDYAGECQIRSFPYKMEHSILAVPAACRLNTALKEYQLREQDILDGSFLSPEVAPVPLEEFRDSPFVGMRPGNDMYNRAAMICRNAGFELEPVIMVDQILTGLNIAANGVGNFIVRSDAVRYYPMREKLIFYKLGDPLEARQVSFLCKQDRYLSAAMKGFLADNRITVGDTPSEDNAVTDD